MEQADKLEVFAYADQILRDCIQLLQHEIAIHGRHIYVDRTDVLSMAGVRFLRRAQQHLEYQVRGYLVGA